MTLFVEDKWDISNLTKHNTTMLFHLRMSLTFDSVSYDLLGEVSDGTPRVAIISAGDVAQSGHVLPRHQLVGL